MKRSKKDQGIHSVLIEYLKILGYVFLFLAVVLVIFYSVLMIDKVNSRENTEDISKVTIGMSSTQVMQVMRNEPQISVRLGDSVYIYNVTSSSEPAAVKFDDKQKVTEVDIP